MIKGLKDTDTFTKNIIIVFSATSLANFFNLIYQLIIAHRLEVGEFAAFNSLLAIFMLVSAPLGTMQIVVTKYVANFNARGQTGKINFLLVSIFRKTFILATATFLIFLIASPYIVNALKIPSLFSGYILATLLALAWFMPSVSGAIQGLELFGWFSSASVISGAIKLLFTIIFLILGFNIAGCLGALLFSLLANLVIFYFPLKRFLYLKPQNEVINYKEIFLFLFPVAISNLCFIALVSFDMVLVKYFFTTDESGLYSLAQMVGKIFLFLPGAISIVMFPKTSGLNAKNLDTVSTLKKALFYVFGLCILANLIYNLLPGHVLGVLTGKIYPEPIFLGRLFGISMSAFSLLFILISYFLSLKDLRFIKYLVFFTLLQFAAIVLIHSSLVQVQLVLCVNSILLLLIHFLLLCKSHKR